MHASFTKVTKQLYLLLKRGHCLKQHSIHYALTYHTGTTPPIKMTNIIKNETFKNHIRDVLHGIKIKMHLQVARYRISK